MCQNIQVKTVVDSFVQKGFMFTAFDVTKLLRAGGSNTRHSDVNTAVKQMFRDGEMSGYLREVKDVGAPVAPFVYYHQNADLDNYVSDWIENNPSQDGMRNDGTGTTAGIAQPAPSAYGTAPTGFTGSTPVTAPKVSVASVTTSHTSQVKPTLPKGVHATDKEGRLYISPVITSSVGLKPAQMVWITKDNGNLAVKSVNVGAAWPVTVNSDGRIRVCRSLLKRITNGPVQGYKVSTLAGQIEVSPA